MEKRKSKHGDSQGEPKKKRQKKGKQDPKGSKEPPNISVDNKNDNKKIARETESKTKKTFNRKIKKGKVVKSERKPVSMQNLLNKKLRQVQQNRLEKTGDTKAVIPEETEKEYNKPNDIRKSVSTSVDGERTEGAETGQNIQKPKKDKKRKRNTETENAKETKSVSINTETQEDEEMEEDPEKAAIRKKKREKRKQKKLEKERIKQENKDKAGTANTTAIDYLNQWKNSRQDWKFLKVRQVWLLQNMYDQDKIDDGTFEILLEYLEGLKGRSREVTVSEAETTLSKAEADEEGSSVASSDRARQVIQLLSED